MRRRCSAAQIPFNRAVDPSDIEETLGLAGYVLLLAALGMTVVAAGRGEVPYFLAIWAVATFGYAVGGFLDSNWASRYSPIDRCFEESSAGTSATKQIWPPGVRCAGNRDEDFVGANVVDGLIPAGLLGRTGPLRQFPAAWRDFPAVGPRRRTMTVTATV